MKFLASTAAFAFSILSLSSIVFANPVAESKSHHQKKQELWGNTDFVKRSTHDHVKRATNDHVKRATNASTGQIKPKIFLISMFEPEAAVWYGIPEFDVLAQNITLPGLSPLYSMAHCTADGDICQFTLGESEINAASSVSALALSDVFDLSTTYFMIAGIAGINPEVATICSVTFARYAIQVALQYEFDVRELSANFTTGYIPFGVDAPNEYPTTLYGTEVFEVNQKLQEIAIEFASKATLNDSDAAIAYRANYGSGIYAAGSSPPGVYACDVATSDVYYSGRLLSEAFGNFSKLMTNGSGVYCSTAQEDNATLEVLLRAALFGLVDYSRVIVMRTASDFDRQYPGEPAWFNLFYANQGAFLPAVANIYLAGIKVVEGILQGWDDVFAAGIKAENYVGDIFGTLGGTPDFGPSPGSTKIGKRGLADKGALLSRGSMMKRDPSRAGIKVRMPAGRGM